MEMSSRIGCWGRDVTERAEGSGLRIWLRNWIAVSGKGIG